MSTEPSNSEGQIGPIIALVLIITLLIVGAVYYFQREHNDNASDLSSKSLNDVTILI